MVIGHVVGHAVSTIKHRSLNRQRLVVVQPHRAANNDPFLALDTLGSRVGDVVIASSDGIFAREVANDMQSPARWTILGIVDWPEGQLVE